MWPNCCRVPERITQNSRSRNRTRVPERRALTAANDGIGNRGAAEPQGSAAPNANTSTAGGAALQALLLNLHKLKLALSLNIVPFAWLRCACRSAQRRCGMKSDRHRSSWYRPWQPAPLVLRRGPPLRGISITAGCRQRQPKVRKRASYYEILGGVRTHYATARYWVQGRAGSAFAALPRRDAVFPSARKSIQAMLNLDCIRISRSTAEGAA